MTEPDFANLALTTPYSREEWHAAWSALRDDRMWSAVVEMSRRGALSPKAVAESLLQAVEVFNLRPNA